MADVGDAALVSGLRMGFGVETPEAGIGTGGIFPLTFGVDGRGGSE